MLFRIQSYLPKYGRTPIMEISKSLIIFFLEEAQQAILAGDPDEA
jgi:hypothetical protein